MIEIGKQTHYQREMFKIHNGFGTRFSATDKRRLIERYPESEKKAFRKALYKQLKQIVDIAHKHNIDIRIDCGTLLGFHRDHKMLPWDFDNDVSCKLEDLTPAFIEELMYNGLLKIRRADFYFNPQELLAGYCGQGAFVEPKILKCTSDQKFFDNTLPVCTDIFTWVKYNDLWYSHLNQHIHMVQTEENIYPLRTMNEFMLIPNNTDTYLEWMYGEDWRVPNPNHKDRISHTKGLQNRQTNGMIMQNLVTKEIICKPIHIQKSNKNETTVRI